jgi:hypothetical protein
MNAKTNNTSTGTAAAAGIAGAVVGAGVAIAATKVMSDKNMREKVTGVLTNVKDQVMDAVESARTNGENALDDAQGKIETAKKEIKDKS